MRHDPARRPPTSIGALTRKDRYREAALGRKIDDAYRNLSTTSSRYRRRRYVRAARRHERALAAQRRRPQSLLGALATGLVALLAAIAWTRASLSAGLVVAGLLLVDALVLLRRRRLLRRA